jgi:dethiobiotin synthetase
LLRGFSDADGAAGKLRGDLVVGAKGGVMSKAYFLTGTDTEVGKTFIACALLHAAQRAGKRVLGMKPVAAGTVWNSSLQQMVNEDVQQLRTASNVAAPLDWINPYCFNAAIAPHIAAAEEGRQMTLPPILSAYSELQALADWMVVEGVGGFQVPLGEQFDSADLAQALNLPVILVVGLRLGCINHALLSAAAIRARGLKLVGWVGNSVDPNMARQEQNLVTLNQWLGAPCLGVVPRLGAAEPAFAADFIRLPD